MYWREVIQFERKQQYTFSRNTRISLSKRITLIEKGRETQKTMLACLRACRGLVHSFLAQKFSGFAHVYVRIRTSTTGKCLFDSISHIGTCW